MNYRKYLLSKEWAIIRVELFLSRGRRCERCKSTKRIQVHHKTYKNIFNESPEDLEILCEVCHQQEHKIKKPLKQKKHKYTPAQWFAFKKKQRKSKAKKKLWKGWKMPKAC